METGNKITLRLMGHLRNLRKSACICALFVFAVMPLASWASIFSGEQSGKTGMMGNEFFARDIYSQNKIIPGMENLPLGMITLSSGAFKNDSPNFMANHLVPADYVVNGMNDGYEWWEPFAELLPTDYRTLQKKFDDSSSNNLWQTDSIYKWINNQAGINNKYNEETVKDDLSKSCLTNGKECRSVVIANHYSKGTDYWGTVSSPIAAALTKTFNGESYLLDSLAAEGAKTFLDEYTGKRFPALMTIYFAGLDHEAHGNASGGGMGKYKEFFTKTADAKILEAVNKLKEKGQFENKIFIVTADHGHTGMAEGLKYDYDEKTEDEFGNTQITKVKKDAEISCELKLDFAEPENTDHVNLNRMAELNNNSLHIWELANLFQQFGSAEGLKLLVPKEIEQAIVAGLQNGETPAVTSIIDQANVIAALNGPMAHVYVKGATWAGEPDQGRLNKVLRILGRVIKEGANSIDPSVEKINAAFPHIKSSIDNMLVRKTLSSAYEVVAVKKELVSGVMEINLGTMLLGTLDSNANYVKASKRIENMNHPQRSGDIVLLMKSNTGDDMASRYSTGVSCKSWHGSLNKSDSYVPFIISYPGGNKFEIEPFVNAVCPSGQCEGNWKLSDIVKKIIETQYSGQ